MQNFTLLKTRKSIRTGRTFKRCLLSIFTFFFGITLLAQIQVDVDNAFDLDIDICRYHPSETAHKSTIKIPANIRNNIVSRGAGCATFLVTYNGFTPQAEAAFQYAVDIWSNLLESPVDIRINATFGPLGAGVLGSAGPNGYIPLSGAGLPPNTAYPRALAEKISGADIPDGPTSPSTDINATFSSTANFYFGLDANPPISQIDFVSVVLHELGHGLGIAGFARVPTDATGVPDPNPPVEGFLRFGSFISIWDNFIENGSATAITSYTDPSAALLAEYTGNDLYTNSPIATAQNGGTRPSTYAPSTFQPGSSYSHWDESTYPAGNPNSLMTPSIAPGEAIHDPGLLLLGFMEDMGWSICGGTLSSSEFKTSTIEVHPNPFNTSFEINLGITTNDFLKVQLVDIKGRIVYSQKINANNGVLSISQLHHLEDSIYFLKVTNTNNGSSITKKLVKN